MREQPGLTRQGCTLRPARLADVPAIHRLLTYYASRGNLLPRSREEITRHLREFFVVTDHRGELRGCAALEILSEELGEIRSLVVDPQMQRGGHGRVLAQRLIEVAREIGLSRVMALTYVPEFFLALGFRITERERLPEKVWQVCVSCYKFNRCDEIAVIRELT